MTTTTISLTTNVIHFVKEIRSLAGSIPATILWQQLEYWFSKQKKSFYKFQSPPETAHHLYRPGDSWTEELGFSKDEFRTAFDKIGVRHPSKKT